MRKFGFVLAGFVLGALAMFVLLPEFSFEQHTIDLDQPLSASSSSASVGGTLSGAIPLYTVARVVDGDTIDVALGGGKPERVRFIGIDTPETVDPRKPVQCYGPEASARMKALLSGKQVTLESKPDEDKDEYGRLLRYVYLSGKDIGAEMLSEGYARSLCAAFPHPKCAEYDALEAAAKAAKLGRWAACGK